MHIPDKSGHAIDLPATSDAARGGFIIETYAVATDKLEPEVIGTIRGKWGFDAFEGPVFHLQNAHAENWTIASTDESALIVGRENTIHFKSDAAACVDTVTLKNEQGKPIKKTPGVRRRGMSRSQGVPERRNRGKVTMLVKQYSAGKADEVELQSYAEAAHLDKFAINAGDSEATLIGTRLDQVAAVELNGIRFAPAAFARVDTKDKLRLSTTAGDPSTLHAGDKVTARTWLKDGRVLNLKTTIDSPRPNVTLLNKSIQPGPSPSAIQLGDQDELPQGGKLSFFLKTEVPDRFSRTQKIEVATTDGSYNISLSLDDGSLLAQDAHIVMATLDPLKSFGPSAFGPLRFRAVDGDVKGDWQPLATLVRLPALKEVHCPDSPDKQCTLTGTNLFLISSVGSDPGFKHSVPVPEGFADSTLSVPHPHNSLLYIKLRDDSSSVNPAALPILPEAQ